MNGAEEKCYTDKEIHDLDAGMVTLGHQGLRRLVAKILMRISSYVVDGD